MRRELRSSARNSLLVCVAAGVVLSIAQLAGQPEGFAQTELPKGLLLNEPEPQPQPSQGWTPLQAVAPSDPDITVDSQPQPARKPARSRPSVVDATADMYLDAQALRLVRKRGLSLVPITWEDTGRFKGSSVGPNISDLSIQVDQLDSKGRPKSARLMPVIRYDNFVDRTADVDPMRFTLLVGNQRGAGLKQISLREFLDNPTTFLSEPRSWRNPNKSLLAPRDTRVLVSAQAVFLPIDKLRGRAEFNPVLFNYQSSRGNPAVLTIMATNQGTSVQVIENTPDFTSAMGWGQRLFHNTNGQRTALVGTRKSDEIARRRERGQSISASQADAKATDGMNTILLIQVPLKHRAPEPSPMASGLFGQESAMMLGGGSADSEGKAMPRSGGSNVEAAAIGFGPSLGPMPEINGLSLERDPRFPIRVTVQFYKATSNGVINEADVDQIKAEIDGVLAAGDRVGSLVVDGDTGRATEYEGSKQQPESWWADFFRAHLANTGETPEAAQRRLTELIGVNYKELPTSQLALSRTLNRRGGQPLKSSN